MGWLDIKPLLSRLPPREFWTSSSTSSATWLPRKGRPCLSCPKCSCCVWTTGSWRHPRSTGSARRKRTGPPTRWTTPGVWVELSTSTLTVSSSWLDCDLVFNKVLIPYFSHAVIVTGFLFPVFPSSQVALLLPRPPEQRQPAALRNHSSVRPQFAQVHFHRDATAAPGEVQGGKGQAVARETHPHPHTFPQVRGNCPGFTSKSV